MTDWYYHLPGQGRVGPLGADDVREAYRDGRVQRDTLAWHVGARDWQPLDRFSDSLGLDEMAAPVARPPVPATPAAVAGDAVDRASPYAPPRAALSESGGASDFFAVFLSAGAAAFAFAPFLAPASLPLTSPWAAALSAGLASCFFFLKRPNMAAS